MKTITTIEQELNKDEVSEAILQYLKSNGADTTNAKVTFYMQHEPYNNPTLKSAKVITTK